MMRARIMSPTAPDKKRTSIPGGAWALLLCALLLPVAALPARTPGGAPAGKDLRGSEEELKAVKSRIEALRQQLQRERGLRDALDEALESAEKTLSGAQAQLQRLRLELRAQNQRIAATQAQQAEAEDRLKQQQAVLAQQIRATYAMGSRTRTQLWLSQQDAARAGRVLTDYDYVNRARAQQISQVHAQIDEIAALEARLVEERSRLQALEAEKVGALEDLEQGRSVRKQTLAQIQTRIASSETELKQAQATEQQVKKLLDSLRDALSDIPMDLGGANKPFAEQRGRLPWPLRGPVLADFGSPKAGGRLSWTGRWIGGREGAPVRAVARGRVAHVGWLQRYGLLLILEHSGGFYTLYGHCTSVAPGVGEWVEAGQVVATAGNTGGHDRSGVYLEIRQGSTAVDPRQWLGQ